MTVTPLKVGIIGTGYVAQRRAEALQADTRTQLLYVAGHNPEHIDQFCQKYGIYSLDSWQQLVTQPDIDLVIVCSINSEHGLMTRAALTAGKHVIVEYPLALTEKEGEDLLNLAQQKGKLLHIEHLEILGELHQTLRQYLPELGTIFSAKYITITPQRPTPIRWNFHKQQFGFPLIAALSRIHRLTDLFGQVSSVDSQCRWWDRPVSDYFMACFAQAKLHFKNGIIGEIVYGKGEVFWQNQNEFVVYGEKGLLTFQGEKGTLITENSEKSLVLGSRQGLFAKDTKRVIDHLLTGMPLYVTPEASLYALKVAVAAQKSAESGQIIPI